MDFSSFDVHNYPTLSVTEGYKEWVNTYEETVQDEMDIRLLSRITTVEWATIQSAVDLACGTGRTGNWLKQQGVKNIDGIDLTPEMLDVARKKQVYRHLVVGDILNTGFGTENYQLTTLVLADEHLEDLLPLYKEAWRLTRSGGNFVIVGYHPHFLMNGIITHFHRQDGEPVAIQSYVHLLSAHFKAAQRSGWRLIEMDEGVVDNEWLAKKPNWVKYANHPVSFSMVWHTDSQI
ncbi:class I SAM-dependent methyltransferase [candidate division KSB1 bacterium]|nr:class I SAM-dependent methyltransferase [candidate division KSB1 bacterium]NIR72852.1 class I SAM-dependent methyltransferase [candidate division KSB1 bacterium]NIS23751.1 class I SAM-dependent methyltransferase [candidate division KSB1 bacterium]NIT70672.1 class I SAM-dependent methyltransferase [candidate division KSB1 bacterium]NIU24401.1 class I SAM-dependent methyltransferase [candidate division KSB1 bacterium]